MEEREKTKNFIITLTGPSGCGKSFVMKRIMNLGPLLAQEGLHFSPHSFPKYVTRPMRHEEIKDQIAGTPIDIISVDTIPKDCELKYQTYGKQYAIRLNDLKQLLKEGKSPVVVINDVRVVEELKRVFPNQVLALFLFREIPKRESFEKEAKKRGGGAADETNDRFNKATAIYRTYIENIGVFNRVILNVGNDKTEDYAQIQIENLIRSILCGDMSLSGKRNGKPKLFIIAGHAKSGKDEIIKAVDDMGRLQATIIRKYTSRRQDSDDGNEMICRLIPSKELLNRFTDEYNLEVNNLSLEYKEMVKQADLDIDELTDAAEWYHNRMRSITKPTERFWNYLEKEEAKIADLIRRKIIEEADKSHKLDSSLYSKSIEELKELYCRKGYHKDTVDAASVCKNWDGQQLINAIMDEADVENDVREEKVGNIQKLNDLITLYKKQGYHKEGADIDFPDRERARVENELFIKNPEYIDLVSIIERHENATSVNEQPKRWDPEDNAFYIKDNGIGYIIYENNKTKYGFEVYDVSKREKILSSKLKREKKHLVLVASLPEIFKWCEKYTDNNVVTVFSHSEISVEEFKKAASSPAAIRKIARYPAEIMKYSRNISKFDHVTIFAEEHINKTPGGREEELIDQIFRLFRFYNGK